MQHTVHNKIGQVSKGGQVQTDDIPSKKTEKRRNNAFSRLRARKVRTKLGGSARLGCSQRTNEEKRREEHQERGTVEPSWAKRLHAWKGGTYKLSNHDYPTCGSQRQMESEF
jgi:hypothetical protein